MLALLLSLLLLAPRYQVPSLLVIAVLLRLAPFCTTPPCWLLNVPPVWNMRELTVPVFPNVPAFSVTFATEPSLLNSPSLIMMALLIVPVDVLTNSPLLIAISAPESEPLLTTLPSFLSLIEAFWVRFCVSFCAVITSPPV